MGMFSQIKSLAKHSAIYTISTVIQRSLGLVMLPIYTDTAYLASKSEFTDYTLIYVFIAFMNVIYLYGIDSAFMRYFFLGKQPKKDIYRSAIQLLSITAFIGSAIIFVLARYISFLIFNDFSYDFIVKIAAVILLVDTLCNLPYLVLRAEERSSLFAGMRIFRFVLEIILNIVFVVVLKFGVKGILYANLSAAFINLIALLPFQLKYLDGKFSKDIIKSLLSFGLPMIPNSIAYVMVDMSDKKLMLHLLDKDTVAEYGANYKFGTLMLLLVTAFRNAWQPFFLKLAKQADAKEIYARVMTYFVLAGSFVVLIGSYFIEDILKFPFINGKTILGKEFWSGIIIIPIILLSYLFYGMYANLTVGIYIKKRSHLMIIFTGLAAAVNIGSNFYLMPNFGMMGAAFATLLAYLIMMLSIFIANQKIYPVKYEYMRLALIFSYLIISLILFYIVNLSLIVKLGIIIGMLLFILVTNFFKEDEKMFLKHILSKYLSKE